MRGNSCRTSCPTEPSAARGKRSGEPDGPSERGVRASGRSAPSERAAQASTEQAARATGAQDSPAPCPRFVSPARLRRLARAESDTHSGFRRGRRIFSTGASLCARGSCGTRGAITYCRTQADETTRRPPRRHAEPVIGGATNAAVPHGTAFSYAERVEQWISRRARGRLSSRGRARGCGWCGCPPPAGPAPPRRRSRCSAGGGRRSALGAAGACSWTTRALPAR